MTLSKQGKRKCWKCKVIKDLTKKNFGKSKRSADGFFKWICNKCSIERLKTVKNNGTNVKDSIFKKLGRKCNMCGVESEIDGFYDIDHIKPKLRHTKHTSYNIKINEISNLQVLCPNCHRIKTISDREIYKWGRPKNK